jgi:YesN/AraC family two-component response regulator
MDFDDYLCKPVDQETLIETIEQHLASAGRTDGRLDEFFRIRSKLSVLEEKKTRAELEEEEEFQQLRARAETLADELDETVEDFDELRRTHRSISRSA